jgi:hypothetical protein
MKVRHFHVTSLLDRLLKTTVEEEKEDQQRLEEKFQPLLDWLKVQAKGVVRSGNTEDSGSTRILLTRLGCSCHLKQASN